MCRNGRRVWLAAILLVAAVLTGCIGPGLSDWDYALTNGYEIWRMNGYDIALVIRENPNDSIASTCIEHYFVTEFCNNQRYIGLRGIPTAKAHGASEEELEHGQAVYYLVDTVSDTVYGPFQQENAYLEQWESLNAGEMGTWFSTRDPGSFLS